MGEVAFRRINGRIVPIKVNKQSEKNRRIAKGAGILAAGVGLHIGGEYAAGRVEGKALRKMMQFGDSSIELTRVAQAHQKLGLNPAGSLVRAAQAASVASKASKRAKFLGKAFRFGGENLGAALAGIGTAKIVNQFTPGKEQSLVEETSSHITGAALSMGGWYLYKRGVLRGAFRGKGAKKLTTGAQLNLPGF